MFSKRIFFYAFALWVSCGFAWGDERQKSDTKSLSPMARTALLTVGINATMATVSYFAFWQGKTEAFHVKSDGWFGQREFSLGADKVGHVWTAYQLTNFSAWSYRMIGVPESWADLGGMINAQLALLIMEIGDGMSPWGFSNQDVISNGIGALFAYSRMRWPVVQDLTDFKLTYLLHNTAPLTSGEQEPGFFENYDEMTYWFVLRGKRLLPRRLNFIGLAVGFHTEGYHYLRPRKREWLIALDVDLLELIRPKNSLLQNLVSAINIYHFPFFPALKSTTHLK